MTRNTEKKRNFLILVAFSALFSAILMFSLVVGESTEIVSAAESTGNSSEKNIDDINAALMAAAIGEADMGAEGDISFDDDSELIEDDYSADALDSAEEAVILYTVIPYEAPVTMYSSDTVNVRAGAGTEYDRVGKVSWGTPVDVLGVTDNGWYEISYNGMAAFIRGDYIVADMPGIPYLFVGDSRTVQLSMAVGSTDKAYIAKVGEGYNYFKDVVIPAIPEYAGHGTTMIINFGVNDLANASKYIKLINANIDTWDAAGVTVYYSSVTPVGSNASVSNSQIEAFNNKLKEGLDSRILWIDSYSYLSQVGFSSSDGLHYNKETYKNLYSYYMSVVKN